jgi:small subunit ribosomal protein S1
VIEGRVRNLTDFGAFVEVEEGIDGLIHISDMSWHRRLKHPSEVLKKGDTVKARVINVDGDNQRLSLSIREFLPNEWDTFAKGHNVGDEVVGQISKITDFGLFIRLADGVEGLAHVSEVQRDRGQKLDKSFHVGDAMRARIIKIDPAERKIGLTTRDVEPLSNEELAAHGEANRDELHEMGEHHVDEHHVDEHAADEHAAADEHPAEDAIADDASDDDNPQT